MALIDELRAIVADYIAGRIVLAEVRRWLAAHVQAVANQDEPALDSLDGLVWMLISEYDYGHRREESIRDALLAELNDSVEIVIGDPPPVHSASATYETTAIEVALIDQFGSSPERPDDIQLEVALV